ncbi:MAG TPA: hypothetical protein VM487_18625 [Phycisphaerae bacterium]|nr:hypothetical protein [Phycisphaerae bacterium]
MAITNVTKISESGYIDAEGYHYTTRYRVTSNSATEATADILTASFGGVSVPSYGDAHAADASAFVTKVGPATLISDSDFKKWELSVVYDDGEQERPANPLNDPVSISWGHKFITEVVAMDVDGAPIDNSAGEPFDPPLEQEVAVLTLRVRRNESTFNPALAHAYTNTVNSDNATIAGLSISARQGKVANISGESDERNGVDYFAVTYELEFREGRWDRDVLDVGFHYLSAGEPVTFKDDEKATMQTPQLLNGSGAASGTPVYLTFQTYQQSVFANLNLNI